MSNIKVNATLQQIADRLGLNVGTVSRALNGSPRVREETRRLVHEAASDLQYRPNKSARNLVRGKAQNRFIAILMPNIVHQFFLGVLKGIIDELSNASFNVIVFTLRGNRSDVIDRILDEAPDGLLVFAKELSAAECARRASMPSRHGMASRALSLSPYRPGLTVELGPLTQSRRRTYPPVTQGATTSTPTRSPTTPDSTTMRECGLSPAGFTIVIVVVAGG